MITSILCFYKVKIESSVLMGLGNAKHSNDSKNVISTFKNGGRCTHSLAFYVLLPQICSLNWTVTAAPWDYGRAA